MSKGNTAVVCVNQSKKFNKYLTSPRDFKGFCSGVWDITPEVAKDIEYVVGAVNGEYVGVYKVNYFEFGDRTLQPMIEPAKKVGIKFIFEEENPIHLSNKARKLNLKQDPMQAYKIVNL